MSFFPTEKRQILKTTPNDPLGPGKYHPPALSSHHRASYAPFGSLSSKKGYSNETGLGPGQYNISSPIIRPSITKYQNKNIIIVKVNDEGGHQFKSRTNRFQQTSHPTDAGPGSYDIDGSASPPRVRSTSLHPKSTAAHKVRAINRQFCDERKPTLLSDPPLHEAREGREGRSESASKGVLNWNLNRKERFQMLVKQPFDQNDKRKAISQFTSSRKKKVRPSAVFASKSIKSHLQTQIYKTNNSFKAELRKMIDYKDEQPGPGSYQPTTPTAGPRVLPKFQFFGSTVQRFPQAEEQVVGPGLYEVAVKAEKVQPRQSTSFSEDRHSYLAKNLTPGPGAYQVERPVIDISFSDKELDLPFGSQKPRFIYDQREEEGESEEGALVMRSYFKQKQAKRQQQIKLLKKIAEEHPSAVFTSQTNRFDGSMAKTSSVQVGAYDITQNDITAKVCKHQKLIQQLEECQLHKPPFLSGNPRFKQPPKHQSEHKNCWCQVKSVQKQMIDHESPVFISNDRRTTFEQTYKAPPVGYYNKQDSTMVKDSFNSRFRKKQQNNIKKDAMRNKQPPPRMQTQVSQSIDLFGKASA